MIYSPWFSNLLAWTFFRWWGLWACDQWYRAHFSWNFEEWPFHFYLQVHAFHKCDSLWPETDNLCIIHDCHTSCDQWSFMDFFFRSMACWNFFLYHLSMMGFAEAYLEGVREFTALLQSKLLLCIYCKRLSTLTVLVGEYIWEKGKSGDRISWGFV